MIERRLADKCDRDIGELTDSILTERDSWNHSDIGETVDITGSAGDADEIYIQFFGWKDDIELNTSSLSEDYSQVEGQEVEEIWKTYSKIILLLKKEKYCNILTLPTF